MCTQCKTAHVQEKTAPTSWWTGGFINADTKLKSSMQQEDVIAWEAAELAAELFANQTHDVYTLGKLQLNPWL